MRTAADKHHVKTGRQSEVERKLNYQWSYRAGDLPPETPPNHYSVHLHRPYSPGAGLAPPARVNLEGLACDWQQQLGQMGATVGLLHAKCERELGVARQYVAPEDTVALRQAVNASLTTQIEYFTRCTAAWAGATPSPHCE